MRDGKRIDGKDEGSSTYLHHVEQLRVAEHAELSGHDGGVER